MSSTSDGFEELAGADLWRRALNIVRPGKISAVDFSNKKKPRIRVKSGNLESNWIPWASGNAGGTKRWNPPSVGEQVIMLSPGGDMSRAVAVCGIFSTSNEANGDRGDIERTTYPDGTVVEYDQASKTLTTKLCAGGKAIVEAPAGLTFKGNVEIIGDLKINGSTLSQGEITTLASGAPVNSSTHLHSGVLSGPGNTLTPVPGT